MTLPKHLLLIAVLGAFTVSTLPVFAQSQDVTNPEAAASEQMQQASEEDMKVTGMVTAADQQTGEITIDEQTYVIPKESGGASLFPQVGAEMTRGPAPVPGTAAVRRSPAAIHRGLLWSLEPTIRWLRTGYGATISSRAISFSAMASSRRSVLGGSCSTA
jgi:hypothetical protein